jgi:diguanylate cyclase (GGDEF)-like protein
MVLTLAHEIPKGDRDFHGQCCRELSTALFPGVARFSFRELPRTERALSLRWAAVNAALLLICLSSASQSPSVANSLPERILPTLVTARAAHSLTDEEAKRAYPVHLRGVITYFDPDFGTGQPAIFIHDATGGIFIKMICKLTCEAAKPLFVGAVVDVRGVSAPGGFGPVVGSPQIRILGRAPLPANPPRVNFAKLRNGDEDAQWVEVEGSVHHVIEYANSVTLRLEMVDGPIDVTMIKTPGATYSDLVDAQVRIQANAAPTTNTDGQMIGVHLQSPNLAALQVLEPAPKDPFAHPPIPIDKLLSKEYFSTPFHRIHLRGNVTLQWPGSLLCIRDTARGICAQTSQATPVTVGDLVDVAGFVETDNSSPVITDAVFRTTGISHPIAPQPSTADEILGGGFSSELIQVDGQLIGYDLTSSDVTFQLSSGDTLFPATLPKSLAGPAIRAWKIGSRLRITGICSDRIDVQSNVRAGVAVTKSFRVLMRSPADVTLLERPSWWTQAHALILLGLALTATLLVLGWVVILRRRIELQANLLRESEQRYRHLAQHDSLTGLATRTVLEDRMKDAMETAHRHRSGLALLIVDLDKFKEINDTFGHQAGDEVLRATAQRLMEAVRTSDTVVRLGGDEFVVLLPELRDALAAELVAATVVSSLSRPIRFAGIEMPVSVSVGVETAFGGEMDSEALMQHADAALYRAKDRGRNCFQVFAAGWEENFEAREPEEVDTQPAVPKA